MAYYEIVFTVQGRKGSHNVQLDSKPSTDEAADLLAEAYELNGQELAILSVLEWLPGLLDAPGKKK